MPRGANKNRPGFDPGGFLLFWIAQALRASVLSRSDEGCGGRAVSLDLLAALNGAVEVAALGVDGHEGGEVL